MTARKNKTNATASFTCGRGALALAAVAVIATGGAARAQAPAAEQAQLEAQASRSASFDIPAQPLAQALTAFGRQSGLQIAVNAASVAGKTSGGVSGTMGVEQALRQLLAGTGVPYRFTSDNAVTVSSAPAGDAGGAMQLDPVNVQGAFPVPAQAMIDNLPPVYAGGQVAKGGQLGLLGNRDVMDTPFNQTSYTAKKAQDQQARTVRDVLLDDPSVRTSIPDGRVGGDNMFIRGFPATSLNTTFGGLYGILPTYSTSVELAERVEVLKGPSAMLNGMAPESTIGGTVNVVAKRAPLEPLAQATLAYGSVGQVGGHIDVGRRFGDDKQFGVRFNGAFRAGQTAVENNTDQRALAALGLDFRGERVRLSADLGYQYQYIGGLIPYIGLTNNVPLPYAPDARKNIGQLWGYQDRKDIFGVVRGEFDLTERITAYATVGAHDNRVGSLRGGFNVTVNDFSGSGSATPNSLSQYQQYLTGEVGLRALADTGPFGHEIAVTATTFQWNSGFALLNGTPYNTSIYTPNLIARPNIPRGQANKTSSTTLSGLAVADTVTAADKRIQLTLGARLQQVSSQNFNATTGAVTTSYDQSALSPSVLLVVKPIENVSVYANWIQGLQQGAVIGAAFANAGVVLPPYKATQYEAGVKIDWGKLTTTASVFQISQPSLLTDVATNTQFLGGEQVNQGLEFNFFGEVTDNVRILGGAMFLNAVLTRTQGGAANGWTAPFAPGAQFNLGGEWDLPFARGLTLNGRVIYTGAQFIDTITPRRQLPEWARFDVGFRYALDAVVPTGKPVVLRFNVENVFDSTYWAGGTGPATLSVGNPRTFRLALTADF